MKYRTMVLGGLVIPAVAAIAQPPATPKAVPEAKKAAAPAVRMVDNTLRDAMSAQETKVWDSIKNQDWTTFAAFLADDFTEVTGHGFQDKAASLAGVKEGKLNRFALSEWRTTKLGDNGVVVMYKVDFDWAGPDGKVAHDMLYCASTWARQDGKWLAKTHQETNQPPAVQEKKAETPKPAAK